MKLGMVGMWHSHAQGIVQQIAAHPDEFQLAAAWDPEADVVAARGPAWKKLLPDLRIAARPEDVLREKLDGVIVEGRVHQNLEWARLALEAGYPVMLEKPAGNEFAAYQRLVDLAQKKHLRVQLIYLFRYMSVVLEMLARVRKSELGKLYFFRARLPKDLPSYRRFEEELALYRGGIFFEMAGHVIDMMVAVLGRPRAVTPFLAHHHSVPGTFVDNGLAVFEYEHAWAIIEVPSLEVAPASRRIEVFGTGGALAIPHLGSGHLPNANVQALESFRAGEDGWRRHELPTATLQIADLREFAATVARKKEPDYSFEHDLAVQETLLRASRML